MSIIRAIVRPFIFTYLLLGMSMGRFLPLFLFGTALFGAAAFGLGYWIAK